MSEPETIDDEQVAQRMRAGLDALAAEVGDPPPFPGAHPAPRRSHARAYAVAAAVALFALVAGGVVWSQRDDAPEQRVTAGPEAVVPDRPLEETRWWLESATDDGKAVDLREGLGLQLIERPRCDGYEGGTCDQDLVLRAADSCNGVARLAHVEPAEIRLVEQVGGSTLMACNSPLVTLLDHVFSAGDLRYEIDGDRLRLTRDGGVLTYRASDGPFVQTSGTVVDQGEIGPASYRVVYAEGGLTFAKGTTATDLVQGGASLGDDPGRINMSRESIRGRPYVMAIVPKAAARVVYEAAGAAPQELEVHRVDSPVSSVVADFVDAAPDTWQLVAYDTDGVELHRYGWWPREDMGAGRSIEEVITAAGFADCCLSVGARARFITDGVDMTFGSGPLPPSMPRDPADGLSDPARVPVGPDGEAVTGTIRDEAAIRFDCAETRYEGRAPEADAAALVAVAGKLSAAAGCPVVRIATAG